MQKVLGLAMTGGGARGAYQAGVLKRLGEIKRVQANGNPFPIVGGASAGAVNGSALAAGSDDFSQATKVLADLWASLKPSDVFRCDFVSQAHNSLVWILDLSFGGALGGGNARSSVGRDSLASLPEKASRLLPHSGKHQARASVRACHLCHQLQLGQELSFHPGAKGSSDVESEPASHARDQDHGRAHLRFGGDPLVFQPVKLDTAKGTAFFGDGCLRLQQPLSPIIRLGAEKIFAIGVRCENREHQVEESNQKDPSLAQVMGVLFNVMFLDHLLPTSNILNG